MAGWLPGISGNIFEKNGATNREKKAITPPFSPIFIIPSHSDNTPVSPSEISKPVFAESNVEFNKSVNNVRLPLKIASKQAMIKAISKNPIHM